MSLLTVARPRSLLTKLASIVLLGAIAPMAIVGVWLADSVRRSGEAILQARLDSSLTHAARDVGSAWVRRRSALLVLAEYGEVRRALAGAALPPRIAVSMRRSEFADLHDATDLITVHDARRPVWVLGADASGIPTLMPVADSLQVAPSRSASITLRMPIAALGDTAQVGHLEARMRIGALTASLSSGAALAGAVFAIVDRSTGAAMVPLPFDVERMRQHRFEWAGEQWLGASRSLQEPEVELLAAAPITAYTAPLDAAGRRGIAALTLVAVAGLAVTLVLTRRVTRSLVRLAVAADAVTRGDLSPRVEQGSEDEVGRVARAFNGMIESLRRMLRERSEREAVAAVGEFAASLAHEIRNPLSTVRLNLQHLQEQLPADAGGQEAARRALADIDRLDRTVGGVLRMARSGNLTVTPLDLRDVLRVAAAGARAEVERGRVSLQLALPDEPLIVAGNAAALEQLFLNLLLNAVQASRPGSRVGFEASAAADTIVVAVWDEGRGFDPGGIEQAFEPFYSTKPEGTGLGLTVARRIAVAHGGSITIASERGEGTRVRVTLPRGAHDGLGNARSESMLAT